MKFVSIEKKKKSIMHKHEFLNGEGSWTTRADRSEEIPLQEFSESLQALSEVACEIMSIPQDQRGQLKPYRLTVIRTKNGTRSVQVHFNRTYEELGSEQKEKTPMFRIDKPENGESGVVVLNDDHLKIVNTAISRAEDYINGKRQQMTFEEWEQKHEAIPQKENEENLLSDMTM